MNTDIRKFKNPNFTNKLKFKNINKSLNSELHCKTKKQNKFNQVIGFINSSLVGSFLGSLIGLDLSSGTCRREQRGFKYKSKK